MFQDFLTVRALIPSLRLSIFLYLSSYSSFYLLPPSSLLVRNRYKRSQSLSSFFLLFPPFCHIFLHFEISHIIIIHHPFPCPVYFPIFLSFSSYTSLPDILPFFFFLFFNLILLQVCPPVKSLHKQMEVEEVNDNSKINTRRVQEWVKKDDLKKVVIIVSQSSKEVTW